jgi:transposase
LIEEELLERRRDLFTEVELVFFDTTSLYFEGRGGESIGKRGHTKDHRPDLYQMVVGMALDVEGRPINRSAARRGRATQPMSKRSYQ